jgi:aspartyl-tRNA synthetase
MQKLKSQSACKTQKIKQTDNEAGSQETKLRYHFLDRRVRKLYPRGGGE